MTNGCSRNEGGCLCGQVRYSFSSEPLLTAICHCRSCQRQSGSAFSVVCAVANDGFEMTGDTRTYLDIGDSGGFVERRFCTTCGSPLVSIATAIPGLTIIKAGTLDRPARWRPMLEAYCDRAMPWLEPIGAERHARSNLEA
jgi:hypothetical protein